jgi:hypothetical protein
VAKKAGYLPYLTIVAGLVVLFVTHKLAVY